MKSSRNYLPSFAILFLFAHGAVAQQQPQEALCAVCRVHEGETQLEKVAAFSEYQGEKFYFCSKKCKETFDSDPEAYLPPVLPRPAPSFIVQTITGENIALESLRDKVVLLDFWATWCKPCVKSMPELQKLHEQHAQKGLAVLGVSIDQEGEKKIPAFLKKHKITYAIALDSGENPAWETYKVKVIPAMFLINRRGQIVQQWGAEAKMEEVKQAILAQLENKEKP